MVDNAGREILTRVPFLDDVFLFVAVGVVVEGSSCVNTSSLGFVVACGDERILEKRSSEKDFSRNGCTLEEIDWLMPMVDIHLRHCYW